MISSLALPPKTPVQRLLQRAALRQLRKLRLPKVATPIVFSCVTGLTALTSFALLRSSLLTIGQLLDQPTLLALCSQLIAFCTIGFLACWYLLTPAILQAAPKYIAVLPVTSHDWYHPQYHIAHKLALALSSGLIGGIVLSAASTVPLITVSYVGIVAITGLYCGLFSGIPLLHVAVRSGLLRPLYFYGYSTLWLTLLVGLYSSHILQHADTYKDALALIAGLSLMLAVLLVAVIRVVITKTTASLTRVALRHTLRTTHPKSRIMRWQLPHLLIARATLRGLLANKQAGSLALGMIIIFTAATAVARLTNSTQLALLTTTTAVNLLPLSLGSWWLVARPTLSSQPAALYNIPLPSRHILTQQLGLVLCSSVTATLLLIVGICISLRIPLVTTDLFRVCLLASTCAALGYASGVVTYPKAAHPFITLLATLLYLVVAAALLSLEQSFRTRPLWQHAFMHSCIFAFVVFVCRWKEIANQKGLTI